MGFFSNAINTLQILVIALGAGLGAWGVVNLLEGYGNDNPGAKSQGIKQLMAGGGIAVVGATLIPICIPFWIFLISWILRISHNAAKGSRRHGRRTAT